MKMSESDFVAELPKVKGTGLRFAMKVVGVSGEAQVSFNEIGTLAAAIPVGGTTSAHGTGNTAAVLTCTSLGAAACSIRAIRLSAKGNAGGTVKVAAGSCKAYVVGFGFS